MDAVIEPVDAQRLSSADAWRARAAALFEEPLLDVSEGAFDLALALGVSGLAGPDLGAVELGEGGRGRVQAEPPALGLPEGPHPVGAQHLGHPADEPRRTAPGPRRCARWSMERANHQMRIRTTTRWPRSTGCRPVPTRWSSATRRTSRTGIPQPGAVSIRVEAGGAALNLGPRSVQVPGHAHIGADNPRPRSVSKTLVASSRGAGRNSSAIRAAQRSSITGGGSRARFAVAAPVLQPVADGARVIAGLLGDLLDAEALALHRHDVHELLLGHHFGGPSSGLGAVDAQDPGGAT